MARYPSVDSSRKKTLMRKGAWTPQEDQKLIAYIKRHGIWGWSQMAKPAGLARSGKSCRLRWMNYLKPNIRHGSFSKDGDVVIINLHGVLGNRWAAIASKLPGRTDNDVKNCRNTRLKKRFLNKQQQKPITIFDVEDTTIVSDPIDVDIPKVPNYVPASNDNPTLPNANINNFSSSIDGVRGKTLVKSNNEGEQQGLSGHVLADFKDLCILQRYYQGKWYMDQLAVRAVPSYECMALSEFEYNYADFYYDFGVDLWGS